MRDLSKEKLAEIFLEMGVVQGSLNSVLEAGIEEDSQLYFKIRRMLLEAKLCKILIKRRLDE